MATKKSKSKAKAKDVNALEMLEAQHREVEELFEQLDQTEDDDEAEQIFTQLADKLAVHAKIEETHFYPAVKAQRTEDILLESLEEHLAVKRALADLLDMDPGEETFDAKVKVLQEQVEHHVEEEESDLFPKVKQLMSEEQLVAIAQEMAALQAELEDKDPRLEVPNEIDAAAPL